MSYLKRIPNIFSCLVLLISLVSFSGFTGISSNYEKPQTELVVSKHNRNESNTKTYKTSSKRVHKVVFNEYIVFSFKSLLNIHTFNFTITLKSQKKNILEFEDYDTLLKQNLIARAHSTNSKSTFLE
ncbi:hypothetical protein [Flavivirga eckloniae]|uniref:Uncharacterized protein n=1 Tax=Flavivirga eckloniae TaxID=1803846 RepID=A0A2K9PUA0_9FLAO|nr:hypothetical protein [Flavivirga eckloniae]AUP80398.1 hypothetical protein C1H87_17445 [Flavivirga eckloniae]